MSDRQIDILIRVLLVVAGAMTLVVFDDLFARFVRDTGIAEWMRKGFIPDLLRMPGNSPFLMVLSIICLLLFHKQTWRGAGFLLLSLVVGAGVINTFLKWSTSRYRPFKGYEPWDWQWFRGGPFGWTNLENLSFGSGDVTLAFAWAASMTIAWPGAKRFFYGWAILTAVQRVGSHAHYLTDAAVGAVVGVVTVKVLFRILSTIVPLAKDGAGGETDAAIPRPRVELDYMTDPTAPYLSLVIPCYNEQENVPTLLTRVEASLNQIGKPYEVVLVDDGSTDKTPEMLAEAQARLPWLRVLRMKKNAGQSAGFEAGFAAARGQYIATIDADLQNDPEEVPRLVKMLDESPQYDMITGWRKDRQDTNFRRWQSRQANKIRNWISQDNINDSACSLKIYRDYTLKGLKLFNGAHRFFPALVKMRGYKVLEVPVKHSARFAGTAKYGFRNRAFRAFIDLLGVRWMKMRYLNYGVDEKKASEVQPGTGI